LIVQLSSRARLAEHVFVWEKLPVVWILLIDRAALPELPNVTVRGWLAEPMLCEPKLSAVGNRPGTGALKNTKRTDAPAPGEGTVDATRSGKPSELKSAASTVKGPGTGSVTGA
jgi:hypothetical protein